jgi:hypothetical protein
MDVKKPRKIGFPFIIMTLLFFFGTPSIGPGLSSDGSGTAGPLAARPRCRRPGGRNE